MDDLLEDAASPEFRAALLAKTLKTARQRKRRRQLGLTLGTALFVAIYVSMFFEMRPPQTMPILTRQPELNVVYSSSADPVPVVGTDLDSASTFSIVQTAESQRPREINDRQLLTLLSGRPVALIRPDNRQAELLVWNPQAGQMLPVR
jgi:hypothetical protein